METNPTGAPGAPISDPAAPVTDAGIHELPQPASQPTEISSNGHAAPNAGSLRAAIQANRAAAEQRTTIELPIPGYSGAGVGLVATYQAIPWEKTRAISRVAAKLPDGPARELQEAADTLAAACVAVTAVIGDQHVPVGDGLNQALARYLDDTAISETGRQAVFEVFGDPVRIVFAYGQYMMWRNGVDTAVDEELVGESAAPGSSS